MFPVSTYRVQLHKDFPLRMLRDMLPYLHRLGVTTVYASPVFEAVPGSTHGYDILNPHRINPELGTEEELADIARWLREHDMNWLQDIVPNHMSARPENPWLRDVLEKGPWSAYYTFFDINWQHPQHPNQLMLPLLDQPLRDTLAAGNLSLHLGQHGYFFQFHDHVLPVSFRAYADLVEQTVSRLSHEANQTIGQGLLQTARAFASLPPDQPLDAAKWEHFKDSLYSSVEQDAAIRQVAATVLEHYRTDTAASARLMDSQYFRLVHWQDSDKAMNYRRFFTVNDLMCLRTELQPTFDEYHRYIKSLYDRGLIQSLRVDHVDGLYNPKQYLERLRGVVGDDTYIIVEKILEPNEYLPADWFCQGTSGYDFLSLVNRLLINDRTADSLSEFYQQMHVMAYDFTEAVYRKKLFMLIHHMGGELDNLTGQLVELFPEYTPTDEMRVAYRQVLAYWLVSFPVYRLYLDETSLSDANAKALAQVFAEARAKAPESLGETFDDLRPLLSPEPHEATAKQMRFLMRTQQFTGPLMAKGVEDTAFYVYNRLISRNEVGDTPHVEENVNVNRFHAEMRKRQPHTMNTTATHDTKRGEDARLRINVLSELPDEWRERVLQWQDAAHRYRTEEGGKSMPDPNDEYFIYQTLVGTYPLHTEPENEAYLPRLKDYLTKVMKEAKVHTSWSKPDEVYEGKVTGFVESLLADSDFLASFLPFVEKVARYGAVYSLVQVLIRLTAPGIPDTYQGTEFWDLSMVDPDNRRPVDYKKRQDVLGNILPQYRDAEKLAVTLTDVLNPALKMHVLHQLLLLRRQQPEVFLHGGYRPLATAGRRARRVAGYVRQHENRKVLVLFPLEVPALCGSESLPVGEAVWEETYIGWEDGSETHTNVFTGEQLQLAARQPVAALLGRFPVGCFVNAEFGAGNAE